MPERFNPGDRVRTAAVREKPKRGTITDRFAERGQNTWYVVTIDDIGQCMYRECELERAGEPDPPTPSEGSANAEG
jgi:hypothetical protein